MITTNAVFRIFQITLFFVLIAIFEVFHFYSHATGYGVSLENWSFIASLRGSIISSLIAGIIGGSTMVLLWEKWLRQKAYGWTLLSMWLTFSLVFFIVSIVFNYLYISSQANEISAFKGLQMALASIIGQDTIVPYIQWLFISLFTMIVFQVSDKYGPGVFKDFLLGKYFSPKKENRVFMFLDLKSSTKIAEALGEANYFNFLNDVFAIITPEILKYKGEIYQYVGDEIIISWREDSSLQNAKFVECFFAIQQALIDKLPYFRTTYDQLPVFKAGLHYGAVVTGEMGIVKRDIVFSGDVLNTASRIQGKCNELGREILVSEYLINLVKKFPQHLNPIFIGNISLRGKSDSIALYSF